MPFQVYFQDRVVSEDPLEETERVCGCLGKNVLDLRIAGAKVQVGLNLWW